MTLKAVPNGQIIEDKICVHWFNTTDKYCKDLPSSDDLPLQGDDTGHYKSQVLTNAADFIAYDTYITTVPFFLWAIFSGGWIDRYGKARKLLLYMNIFGNILEDMIALYLSSQWKTSIYYNLLLHIPGSILGGRTGAIVAIQHYMTSTTPPKLMAIRFTMYELCWQIAGPIGSVIAGYVLVQDPVIKNGEIRNYSLIYIIALAFEFLALLWVILMVDEMGLEKQNNLTEQLNSENDCQSGKEPEKCEQDKLTVKQHFKLFFETIKTIFKQRPNKGRVQLILLVTNVVLFLMILYGGTVFSSQFAQKVYLWAPDWNAYVGALSKISSSVATAFVIPLLSKTFGVSDIRLAIIGFLAHAITNIVKGSWLNSIAYYISIPISAIGGAAAIGTQSHATKIVDKTEIGKLMSFMAAVNSLVGIVTNTLMLFIFKSTIDSYPSTIFLVVAIFSMIAIWILVWIDVYTDPIVGPTDGCSETDQNEINLEDNRNNDNINNIYSFEVESQKSNKIIKYSKRLQKYKVNN